MRVYRLEDLERLLGRASMLANQALGRSRDDKGIGRTSAAVLVLAVFCTGLASYTYLRDSLVRDRTTIIQAELERRSQQLSMALGARMQLARALAARSRTARAMHIYQSDTAGVVERTGALMALQLTAGNLVEGGELRGVELRSLEGERIASAASLPLRAGKRQLQLVADNAPLLIAFLDPRYVFRFANRAHVDWFRRPLDQIVGSAMEKLVGQATFSGYRHAMEAALDTGMPQTVFDEKLREGKPHFIEVTFVAQLDEKAGLEGYCVTARDATAGVVREQALLLAARRDSLTGLCNRTSFNERLEGALRTSHTGHRLLAVAYLDMDYFKQVNDSYGHDVGDRFLIEMGQRVEACLPLSDTFARLGGDEFALLMHLDAPSEVDSIGNKLLASIRRSLTIDGHRMQPSASIGFALAVAGDTAPSLLKRADTALYEAKARGRNAVWQAVGEKV